MYRINRPIVSKLAMADMSKHEAQFWKMVSKRLNGSAVVVFLMTEPSNLRLSNAPWFLF